MKDSLLIAIITLIFSFLSCKNKETKVAVLESNPTTVTTIKNDKNMNSFISIFEIPATDISRAITFYKKILGVEIEKLEFSGMEMGLFPYKDQMVTGVIVKGEGYAPSSKGVTIYLNGIDSLHFTGIDSSPRNKSLKRSI